MNRMSMVTVVFTALLIGATGCGGKGSPNRPAEGSTSGSTPGPKVGSGEMPAGRVKVSIPE